ncbi:AtpZ/AtpI family protein [Fulvivirga lutea]|uniref:AtpZ/AtpI family protein n=1 Tax=Fulvivirga lutea TaxID=2810512 RepID=A0A975A1I3_9BACT|nr:AtpZ/AtpI family protein [Fulvivirga lutea]QSE98346.1 AtpZ/AtpI family protein [Fulvivirga lutea]
MGKTPPSNPREPKQYNSFLKYTGLAIQMGVVIYLGNLLGVYLDEKYENVNGLYEKLVTLVTVFLSIIMVIRQVIGDSRD